MHAAVHMTAVVMQESSCKQPAVNQLLHTLVVPILQGSMLLLP